MIKSVSFPRVLFTVLAFMSLFSSDVYAQFSILPTVTRSVSTNKDLFGVSGVFHGTPPTQPGDQIIEYRVVFDLYTDWYWSTVGGFEHIVPDSEPIPMGFTVADSHPDHPNDPYTFVTYGTISTNGLTYPYMHNGTFWVFVNATVPELQISYLVRARVVREVNRGGVHFTEFLYTQNFELFMTERTTSRNADIDIPPPGGGGQNGGM